MKKRVVTPLLSAALLLAACTKPVEGPDLSAPSFHDKPLITLDVGHITIVNAYTPPTTRNHVERLFPTSLVEGVEIWARDRLRAHDGNARRLEVAIHEASAVETMLPVKKGFKGHFTKEPNRRYDAALDVEIKMYGTERLLPEAHVRTRVTLSRELLEGANARDQDGLFAAMTRDIVTKLDESLEREIDEYFGRYKTMPLSDQPQEW